MKFSLEFVSRFLFENLLKTTVSNDGKKFNARCPFCGDSKKNPNKKRFHLKFESEEAVFFNCFNCDKTGTFLDLYCFINGIDKKEAYNRLRKERFNSLKDFFHNSKQNKNVIGEQKVDNKVENDFSYILDDCISLDSDLDDGYILRKYYDILKEFYETRKIDINYKLYIAYKGEWKGRIIIPVYKNGKIIYFQGRAIDNNCEIKYKNPIAEKKSIIFNEDCFCRDKYIIITEGILDALSIGVQGTMCMGKNIDDTIFDKLFKLTDKGVIVALDNDKAGKDGTLKIVNESKYKNMLKYLIYPNKYKRVKDLNELKVSGDVNDIYSFIVDNSYSLFEYKALIKIKK